MTIYRVVKTNFLNDKLMASIGGRSNNLIDFQNATYFTDKTKAEEYANLLKKAILDLNLVMQYQVDIQAVQVIENGDSNETI